MSPGKIWALPVCFILSINISWNFLAATITLEPCPGAEGTSCVPWEHLSLSSCALTLWKSYCIFFLPQEMATLKAKSWKISSRSWNVQERGLVW